MSTTEDCDVTPSEDGAVDHWDNKMAALTFSRALRFTQELAFGVLAVIGCAIVQCLIVSWLLSCVVQTKFVLLQARLLCWVYGGSIENLPSVKAQRAAPTKNETVPSSSQPPSPPTSAEDLGKEPSVPSEPVELAAFDTKRLEENVVLEAPDWPTKTLTSRTTAHGRSLAIKQVDVPISPGFAPQILNNEQSQAVKQAGISIPPGFGPQVPGNTSPDVVRRVAPRIPPGFGPQGSATEAITKQHSIESPMSTHHNEDHIESASFHHDDDLHMSKAADQLFSPTEVVVKFPPSASDTTIHSTRYKKTEPKNISGKFESHALLRDDDGSAGSKDTRIAKRSAIRKVDSAPFADPASVHPTDQADKSTTGAKVGENAVPEAASSIAVQPNQPTLRTAIVNHSGIRPATLEELRHNFMDTSLLRSESSRRPPKNPPNEVASPLSSEEAAREDLKVAFEERELSRVKLNTIYTHERALDFDEKARTYKERRQDLMACMPWGELSEADELAFPYLSTKDTITPQVNEPIASASQRPVEPSLLPSPPSSSEEYASPLPPREDPSPIIAKASKAYQVLLKFTQNKSEVCPICKSRFCHKGYTGASKAKLKMARDLYLKIRSSLLDVHGGGELPEEVARQIPGIVEC